MTSGTAQLLSNLVDVTRSYGPVIINHYNVAPVFDVYANVDRRDLGSVGAEVEKIMQEEQGNLPRGTTFTLRGEYETMQTSFVRLGLGMVFAVVLVYLLMAVNFQSWLDPFIILTALPGAMAGILWMLFVTGTTLSVPSLMVECAGLPGPPWRRSILSRSPGYASEMVLKAARLRLATAEVPVKFTRTVLGVSVITGAWVGCHRGLRVG